MDSNALIRVHWKNNGGRRGDETESLIARRFILEQDEKIKNGQEVCI